MKELLPIKGFELTHCINTSGEIFSTPQSKRKKEKRKLARRLRQGYRTARLSVNGKTKEIGVHRLLALTFIPNLENKPDVNHKNGIKTDNRLSNLERSNEGQNMKHYVKYIKSNIDTIKTATYGGKYNTPREVIIYDINGEKEKLFPSLGSAAKYIGSTGVILKKAILNGHKTKGYLARFKEEGMSVEDV